MFSVVLIIDDIRSVMDNGLGLLEACFRADVYKKHNDRATFVVVNNKTGDIEYCV